MVFSLIFMKNSLIFELKENINLKKQNSNNDLFYKNSGRVNKND